MMFGRCEVDVPAVFPSKASAEAAVDEMWLLGLSPERLDRAVHRPGHRVVEDDHEALFVRSVRRGMAIGAPLGMLAGAMILFVAQTMAGMTPTLAGVLLAGAGGGTTAGL